jgi:phage/plasmid primase-like uncharacterized protein
MRAMSIPAHIVEQARAVRIEDEIARRGIVLKRQGQELVGSCPKCGGRDRFSVAPTKGVWNCRHCKTPDMKGDVIGFTMWCDGIEFPEAVGRLANTPREKRRTPRREKKQRDDASRIASALHWWNEAAPIDGTIGIAYLERERGIVEPPPDVHEVLRFHPRCIWGQDVAGQWLYQPCILCLLRDVITDAPTGVHRIALHADGKLIGRKALGRKKGSAVKLWGDADITTGLVVGEGIETTLAAATRVRHRNTLLQPAWALVDAPNIEGFPVLPGEAIEHLTILADADSNEAGQTAARTCAKRWADGGCDAEVLIPDTLGEDFNNLARRT